MQMKKIEIEKKEKVKEEKSLKPLFWERFLAGGDGVAESGSKARRAGKKDEKRQAVY